jgi:histidinol-phosphate aminotransferase
MADVNDSHPRSTFSGFSPEMTAMPARSPKDLIRRGVRDLHAYVPGEQPKIKGLIKLNTNENPYPPSPKVLAAVKAAVDGRLRLYPNPTAERLRAKLAGLHRCRPESIIVGNGSDELLALATRAFVDPTGSIRGEILQAMALHRTGDLPGLLSATTIQYFTPSYSLYPVLADIHDSLRNPVPLRSDFSLPPVENLDVHARLTFVTTPNAPGGRGYTTAELEKLCRALKGIVVLDEAYVDFADENALKLAFKYPHVIVSRTFSKAYSLCFQRVGYFVGHPELIAALDKVRDSYNVNGLGQVAAEATLDHLAYYRANFRKIVATRERLSRELTLLGFRVLPSQTNFMLAQPPGFPAERWLKELRDRKILVRWFSQPEVKAYLRITIGTPAEAAALVRAVRAILAV